MAEGEGEPAGHGLSAPIAEGEWAGWSVWTGEEPFEDHTGPYYVRRGEDGRMMTGFRPQRRNMNGGATVHGGALLTFADYSLFMIAHDALKGAWAVTVSLNGEFISGPPQGVLLTARGDVLKAGRNLMFIRGLIDWAGEPVLNFSGVIKTIKPKA